MLPTPALRHIFSLRYIKRKENIPALGGDRGEGKRGLSSEYWRAARGVGERRAPEWEGLQGTHKGLRMRLGDLGAHQGCAPALRPFPCLAFQQPRQHNCVYFISAAAPPPPPPRNTDTIPPFSPLTPPLRLCSWLPGAAPAATETCAPCSKRGHRRQFPSDSAIFVPFFSPSHPSFLPPAELLLPKEGSLETSAGGFRKGNLKLSSRG